MTPNGKVRASCSAVLKVIRAPFRENPVFGGKFWGSELPIVLGDTRGGSGVHTLEVADVNDAGSLVFPVRFRLRYSRIHAALCAGSR